jgi:mycofactocin system creatininase family protein
VITRQGAHSSAFLVDFTWPEVARCVEAETLLAVPLGSTEQHGPHLPLSCDTDIAVALCQRLADARPDVLIAPALAYGSSGEHAGFPGTLSIGQDALETLLVELGRSASQTFAHLLFVSAHGGNTEAAIRAVHHLQSESHDVYLFTPQWSGDLHAGRAETSMLLALTPARVQMQRARPGNTQSLAELWPVLRTEGVRAVSDTGVLGDPTGAAPGEGSLLLATLADALIGEVDTWRSAVSG